MKGTQTESAKPTGYRGHGGAGGGGCRAQNQAGRPSPLADPPLSGEEPNDRPPDALKAPAETRHSLFMKTSS